MNIIIPLRERRKLKFSELESSIRSISVINKRTTVTIPQNQQNKDTTNQSIISSISSSNSLLDSQDYTEPHEDNSFEKSYMIQQKIGEGSHGVVKKCLYKKNGKTYAVKILKMEDQHFRGLKNNFLNMKKLRHQSIIKHKALYLNSKKRVCYLVMERFNHPFLKYPVPQEKLKLIFRKILEALSYSHKNHICHRDIKPQNILFNEQTGVVKIIDFGISKNMKQRGRYEEMLTQTGTQFYKAPQMFLGGGYTEKIDSWAVGVSLYEMIAGVTPFESQFHKQTIDNIIHKQVNIDDEKLGKCSILLKNLIVSLLKKNPKQRLSCTEAKDHIWFIPPIHIHSFMKSQRNIQNISRYYDSSLIFQNNHQMKGCSLDELNDANYKLSQSQKQNIKVDLTSSEDLGSDISDYYQIKLIEGESMEQRQNSPVQQQSEPNNYK